MIDSANAALRRHGTLLKIQPKTFGVLWALVRRAGNVVSKDTLRDEVWGVQFYGNSLRWQIRTLRQILDDNEKPHKYIETSSTRGYTFIAKVTEVPRTRTIEQSSDYQAATPLETGDEISLAILPFKLLNQSSRYRFLKHGMSYTLTSKLTSLRGLQVRETAAVRRCWDQDRNSLSVGQKLGVEWILEGEIEARSKKIRVTVRLMNVQDNGLSWEKEFDHDDRDLFLIQDLVSQYVAETLVGTPAHGKAMGSLTKHSTESTEAYELYINGRDCWNQRTSKGLSKAIEYFDQATKVDSKYALAYAGLADCYNLLSYYSGLRPSDVFPKAMQFAEKALQLDRALAEAHTSRAYAISRCHWKWKEAEEAYQRAIELKPSYPTAHQWYGEHLTAMGRFEEAKSSVRRAQRLDPQSPVINAAIGTVFYFAREYDAAINQYLITMRERPGFARTHFRLARAYMQKKMFREAIAECKAALKLSSGKTKEIAALGQAYAMAGRPTQARRIVEELELLSRESYVSEYNTAIIFVGLGEFSEAFRFLEKAYWSRDPWLEHLNVDPRLDDLRSDARFKDLLRRVGLP